MLSICSVTLKYIVVNLERQFKIVEVPQPQYVTGLNTPNA